MLRLLIRHSVTLILLNTGVERHVAAQLRAVDEETAEKLKAGIRVLADRQSEEAFYDGVRFGAQLMAELLAQ